MSDRSEMKNQNHERPFVVGYVTSPHPHGRLHMQTLEVLPEVAAVHLCSIDGDDIDVLKAASSKVRSTTGSLEDFMARDDLDALLVCVRNDLCPEVLEAAVAAGKPVLFEKPGAVNASSLRRVAEQARERGLAMGTMFQNRYKPEVQDARQARIDGALGTVMAVEARMVTSQVRYRNPSNWLFNRAMAGSGILSWLACHYIDLLCYLLNDRIVEVMAMVGQMNLEKIEVEDTACLTLKFASGVLGTMNTGYHLVGSREGYRAASNDTFVALRGTEGYMRLPLSNGNEYTLLSIAPGWAAGGMQERRFDPPESAAYGGIAGAEFVSDFLQAARTGSPAPVTIDAAVHVLEVVEAALESSSTRRAVRLEGA